LADQVRLLDTQRVQYCQSVVSKLRYGNAVWVGMGAREATVVERNAGKTVAKVGDLLKPDGGVASRSVGEQNGRTFAADLKVDVCS
jgi:molybdate-binding protein